ncbi:MAG: hypothetical protein E4H01_05320 [Lysobacterales bacterium]|nr:MAG: hypothetical protein E4H01_05320 [Xanthomonadales bacterium]
MAVSAVVAVSAAVSYESSRKAASAQKRAADDQEKAAAQEVARQKAADATQAKKDKVLNAVTSSGNIAANRIAAERSYLRRGRTGRIGTIKGTTALG